MTVKKLRKYLKQFDGDLLVVLAKDAEGNSFSPLSELDADNNRYHATNAWSGDVDEFPYGFGEDDEDDGGQPCLVLWPTN